MTSWDNSLLAELEGATLPFILRQSIKHVPFILGWSQTAQCRPWSLLTDQFTTLSIKISILRSQSATLILTLFWIHTNCFVIMFVATSFHTFKCLHITCSMKSLSKIYFIYIATPIRENLVSKEKFTSKVVNNSQNNSDIETPFLTKSGFKTLLDCLFMGLFLFCHAKTKDQSGYTEISLSAQDYL